MNNVLVVNPSNLDHRIYDTDISLIFFRGVIEHNVYSVRDVLQRFYSYQKTWFNPSIPVFNYWNAKDYYRITSVLIGSLPVGLYSFDNSEYWMRPAKKRIYSVVAPAAVTTIFCKHDLYHGNTSSDNVRKFDGSNYYTRELEYGIGILCNYIYNYTRSFDQFHGITTVPREFHKYFGYLYYTNPYGAFEFFPVFCIAKKFRDKKSGRRPELLEIENIDTQEVVWELGIPMESLQRSLSVDIKDKTPGVLFQYFNELLRSYVVYFAPPGHTAIEESMSHWHRVAITSKNVQPDIHKTYVKVEVTAISEVLCPTIKPSAYDE